MALNTEAIEKLETLRKQEKFTDKHWGERGLIPSSAEVVNAMIDLTNKSLDALLADLRAGKGDSDIRNTLLKGLHQFKADDYDTEEREFIGDVFYEIGKALNMPMEKALDIWMYGLEFVQSKPKPVITSTSYPCTSCATPLTVVVTAIKPDTPISWIVATCNNCNAYNFLKKESNIGAFTTENFVAKKFLRSTNYTEAEARKVFEEMRQEGK